MRSGRSPRRGLRRLQRRESARRRADPFSRLTRPAWLPCARPAPRSRCPRARRRERRRPRAPGST
nr:MAG: hypothetical protein DIU78_07255 [Pseudomonadota bacterium]